MSNQTLQRVLNAIPFRDAGNLHNQLRQEPDRVSAQTRTMVRNALRSAGLVAKKTACESPPLLTQWRGLSNALRTECI